MSRVSPSNSVRNQYFLPLLVLMSLVGQATLASETDSQCKVNWFKRIFTSKSEIKNSSAKIQPQLTKTDPFDPVIEMPFGEYAGQVIDTSAKRPAHIIEETSDRVTFANFRHGGAFHQAQVPLDGVEDVYFRINRFAGNGIAHTLLYIKMKPGSEILLGGANNVAGFINPEKVSEFVISMDFTAPKGIKYSLTKSRKPNYMALLDFRSATDYAARGEDKKHLVEYLKLSLDDKEKVNLLSHAIHRSDDQKISQAYDLIRYNCTTEIFRLLDHSINYPFYVKPFAFSLKNFKDLVAGASERALYERGLIRQTRNGKMPAIWAKKDGFLPAKR